MLGKRGEDLAASYLEKKGYEILDRNWKYYRLELDIICMKKKKIIFVEVKTRSTDEFGDPEEAVKDPKKKNIHIALEAYLEENEIDLDARIDIISILYYKKDKYVLKHIKEAFLPVVDPRTR